MGSPYKWDKVTHITCRTPSVREASGEEVVLTLCGKDPTKVHTLWIPQESPKGGLSRVFVRRCEWLFKQVTCHKCHRRMEIRLDFYRGCVGLDY